MKKAEKVSENADQVSSAAPKKIYTSKDVGSAQKPMQSKDNNVRDSKHRSGGSDAKPQRSYQQQSGMKRPNNRLMTEGDLADMQTNELMFVAKRLGIIGSSLLSRDSLIQMILDYQERPEVEIFVDGILEKLPDGFGFLRFAEYDYISGPDDVYVSPSFIRKYSLRTGDEIYGSIRKPKEGEKYFALLKVDKLQKFTLQKAK